MAVRAHYRVHKTSVYIVATVIVLSLSLLLWVQIGRDAAQIVLQATGGVALAIMIGEFITKHWLWKTKIGNKLGFPPDYSGQWEGDVIRSKKGDDSPATNRVEVIISQSVTQVDWHQIGYSEDGKKLAESHFIMGEVIDEHRQWDAILGVYEVQRPDGSKDSGMSFVRINNSGEELSGIYCGMNGHLGKIIIKRKETIEIAKP